MDLEAIAAHLRANRDDHDRLLQLLHGIDVVVLEAAILLLAGRQRAPELCRRCLADPAAAGEDLCRACLSSDREAELDAKRRYARRRGAIDATPRRRAATWLKQELRKAPRPSAEVKRRAAEDGISERTLERARLDAGVVSWRGAGAGQGTTWALPRHAPASRAPASRANGDGGGASGERSDA